MTLISLEPELTVIERSELERHEATIERGLQTFVEVGNALMAIRDGRLYRQTHATFEDYCRERWKMGRSYAYELINAASVAKSLSENSDTPTPSGMWQVRPLIGLSPEQQREAWQEAIDTAPDGKVTGRHVASVVEKYKTPEDVLAAAALDTDTPPALARNAAQEVLEEYHATNGYVTLDDGEQVAVETSDTLLDATRAAYEERAARQSQHIQDSLAKKAYKNSSESNEWYTPRYLIDKAVAVMGGIDLDPATSEIANETVRAETYYTIEDDSLNQLWLGRVWLNPPYGRDVDPFVEKLVNDYESGDVTEALLLVAARTDTGWFRRLRSYPRCFLWGRIKFINGETGEIGDPAGFPSMVVYLGNQLSQFVREFEDVGDVYAWVNTTSVNS